MTISRPYKLIFLSVLLLAVYYPALFAPLCFLDDTNLVVFDMYNSNLNDIFRMLFSNGGYYRPLLAISFILDNYFWLLQESFLHLENVLLHLTNTLLLFGVTERLCKKCEIPDSGNIPFWTALLFGLHPLATESVNWISGRTDPLACMFLLLSLKLLLDWSTKPAMARLIGIQFSFLLACLSKETAVFFVIPAQIILIASNFSNIDKNIKTVPKSSHLLLLLRTVWQVPTAFLFTTCGYFLLRRLSAISTEGRDRGMSKLSLNTTQNLNESVFFEKVFEAFKTIGFYFKKLFVPWPLNFNIVGISDWYIAVGLMILPLLLYYCWKRRDFIAGLFISAALMASSALLVSIGKLAWTWYAERYLYISLIFFIPGCCLWLHEKIGAIRHGQLFRIVIIIFCGVSLITTFRRNLMWMDGFALYEDNYIKAPRLPITIKNYATCLYQQGRISEANYLYRMLPKKKR